MTYPIVVLISGNGSNLQAIIDAIETKHCHATVAAVFSNRSDAFGLVRSTYVMGLVTFAILPLSLGLRKYLSSDVL